MIREAPDTSPDAPQDLIPALGVKVMHRYKRRTHGTIRSTTTHGVMVIDNWEDEHRLNLEEFHEKWIISRN